MAIDTIILQAEDLTVDTTWPNNGATLVRTQTQNQEREGINNPDDPDVAPPSQQEIDDGAFDEYGLRSDYTGTGYVDPNGGAGDKLSFTVNDGSGPALPEGTYDVTVRVAASSNRDIKLQVLDGTSVESETTAQNGNTGEFYQWKTLTFQITIPAGAPVRTIVVEQTTGQGPNIDAIAISDPGAPVTFAAPEITSDPAFTVQENTTVVGQVIASDLQDTTGTDSDLTFALTGADADKMTIDGDGNITLDQAPDFENHADDGADGTYNATVAVSDGVETVTQDITVTVEDVDESPNPVIDQITLQGEDAAIGVDGESFARTQGAALADLEDGYQDTDQFPEGAPNSNKGGNADEPLDAYGLREGYSGTGYLDFEQGTDETLTWTVNVTEAGSYDLHIRFANGGQDRPLDIIVGGTTQHAAQSFASTGFQDWVTQTYTVELGVGDNEVVLAIAGNTNGPNVDAVAITSVGATPAFPPANVAPEFGADVPVSFEVDEATTATESFAATDADDGDTLSYSLENADAGFSIDAATGELSFTAPDFAEGGDNDYTATVVVSDGELTSSTNVTATVLAVDDVDPIGSATLSVNASGTNIDASTFSSGTIQLANTGQKDIAKVTIDLSAALFTNANSAMVFDPTGDAGDETAKGFTVDAQSGTFTVNSALSGGSDEDGYTTLELTFDALAAGNTLDFSIDIDPDSIKGALGAGDAGSVSGLELTGSTVVVEFADGTTATSALFADGSVAGAVATVSDAEPVAPTLTLGSATGEVQVDAASQTISVSGPANATVTVLIATGGLGNGVTAQSLFDANTATGVTYETVTLDSSGQGSFDVTLTEGAPLYMAASVDGDGDGEQGAVSAPLVVAYEEPQTDLAYEVPTEGELVIELANRDGSIVINDDTGTGEGDPDSTQFRDADNPEDNNNGGKVDGLWPGFEGTGYLDMGGQVGDQATFDVTVDADGDYTFTFRYNNGSGFNGGNRPLDIAVDGDVQATPSFANNGLSWTDWQIETVTLTLPEGTSTISITNTVANGPNLDQVTITPPAPVNEDPTALTVTALDPQPAENVAGADVATVTVEDVDTTYAAADLTVSDPAFELVDTATPNTFTLKLKDGEALDFEAGAQPTVTVSLGTLTQDFTPAPLNDESDDQNSAPVVQDAPAPETTAEDTAVTIDVADWVEDDADADADLAITAEATNGSMQVNGTELTFTPDADFNGDAQITWRAQDTEGAVSADATIDVTVAAEDDAPTAVTLTPSPVAENDPGADVATVTVDDVDTTYLAGELTLTDPSGKFELVDAGTANTFTLKLKSGEALDAEASAQPSVTVTAGNVSSATFAPAPSDDPSDNAPDPVALDFNAATISSYTGNQDKGGVVTVSSDGTSMELDGNLWKRVSIGQDYTITADTKLQVTVAVGTPLSEMVAIGFDLDENFSDGDGSIYQLAGSQVYGPFVNLIGEGTDNNDGTLTFEIDLSTHVGTTISSLVFVADDDNANNGVGSPIFSNVVLSDEAGDPPGNAAPSVVGGGVADFTVDEGGTVEVDLPFTDSDGPQPLQYTLSILNAGSNDVTGTFGLSLDAGVLSGTIADGVAPGDYTVTVTANDGAATTPDTFVITVENINEAPVVDDIAAPEPFIGKVGEPIAGIDLAQFDGVFSDPDNDPLTITVEGLPNGLSVDGEGVIVGTPTEAGAGFFTLVATDPDGLRAELQIPLQLDTPGIGDVTVVEAEAFTGLADAEEFYATGQAGASGDQIIRVGGNGDQGLITTVLSQNGLVEGWYQVAMTRYDEIDGSASYFLQIGDTVLADGPSFDGTPNGETPNDTFDNPNLSRGNAGQAGNLKTIIFETPVYVDASTVLTLSGVADGELLRTDKFTFTRIEEPNEAPSAASLSANTVAENAEDVSIGTLSATDPDGDDAAITFSVDPASPFEVVGDELRLKAGEGFDFETDGGSVDVDVTATDQNGGTSVTTLTIAITDVNEAAGAPVLTAAGPVTENVEGVTIGTLSADDDSASLTFSVTDPRFVVVNGNELKLADGTALNFEEGTPVSVDVTVDDGENQTTGSVSVAVEDANDAPVMPTGAAIDDVTLAANTGDTIDLAAALGATDEDAGDTVTYEIAGDDAIAAGFVVEADGTTLTIPASAPAGSYEVTVVATDGVADSESVSFTVTVGEPAPFTGIILQGEDFTDLGDGDGDASNDNLIRTQTQNQEKHGLNGLGKPDDPTTGEDDNDGLPDFDDYGLRPGYSGTGYLDINGQDTGGQAEISFDAPAGTYDLTIRYASGSNNARPMTFVVDGDQFSIANTQTGEWYNWATETFQVTLTGDGPHTLTIEQDADAGAPNIDAIAIHQPGTTVDFLAGTIADTSADADEFPLTLDGDTGELTETQAASINLNVSGDDDDIVKYEVSFDGGATRIDVTDIVDADGDFVVNGSDLAPGPQTATIIVTDGAGNEATATLDFSIAEPSGGTFDPITIQGEDTTQATIVDTTTGTGLDDPQTTQIADSTNAGPFGTLHPGATGNAYVDMGTNPGDALQFTLTVPADGTYSATIRYANGGGDDRPMDISVGGTVVDTIPFVPTTGGTPTNWSAWTDVTVELELTAGQNVIALSIVDGGNNGPNIDEVTFAAVDNDGGTGEDAQTFEEIVKINFEAPLSGNGTFNAPSDYTTPAGFEADTGAAYGDRGNGFTYGWVDIDDATGAVTAIPAAQPTGSMRYKNAASEASDLQKTYAHFDYPGAPAGDRERAWEMELANGIYQLTVAIGDTAGQYDSNYVLNVEGQVFGPSWDPVNLEGQKLVGGAYDASFDGEGFRSNLYTGIVEVTDGRLTIDGTDGDNVEIQWLDIERVPDLTPNDSRSADLDYSKFVAAVAASTADGQVSIEVDENGDVPLDIDPTSSLVVGVQLQAIDHRGPAVASTDGIKLYETLTGQEVAIDVQVTGGADSLTIRPLQDLKEFTSYTLDIADVLDLGNLNDSSLPQRQFQDYSATFVTSEAPVLEAKEVAFTDQVILEGSEVFGQDGKGFGYTSIEFGPDGKLYVSTITGVIHRWDVNSDGTIDTASQETLVLDYFQAGGRSIIGLAFDPEDPNTIWVSDNAPVPRQGKADETPEFSGQVSKITLGADGSFDGAVAETYVTGLPRSGGDHVTNSLEFRNIGTDQAPEYLLYVMQGSNSAAGSPDNAWGFRPERLLNAAALEIDPRRDAPDGGFDVQTEPYDPLSNDPTFRDASATFNTDGTVDGFYDPFADDAVLKIFGEGIRNGYDLVWHSNGNLYVPTNGTARGGITPDDPNTPNVNETVTGLDKQFDYIFQVQEGSYYGHPNPLLGNYIVNGGSGTQTNIYGDTNSANTSDGGNEYPSGIDPDPDYDIDGAYSLGFNKSPNGAIEYTGDKFGSNLQGALLFAQFSVGDNVRVLNVDPITGRIIGDDVLRRPDGDEIDEYIDPLDLIEHPATGQVYMMTLNRGNGQSQIVLLNPAPGGVTGDNTADEGGDLALSVDAADPENVTFTIQGADSDLVSRTVTFTDGNNNTVTETAAGNGTFAVNLSTLTGAVTATLDVEDGAGNTASDSVSFNLGGDPGDSVFLDATAFTVVSTLTGTQETVIRRLDDSSTHEPGGGNDSNGDGLNDNHDGISYLDPNGGAEDKAEFTFDAPAAGTYTFTFRMAANNERTIAFETGSQSETVTVDTGSFTVWEEFPVVLTLTQGPNTITINQPGTTAPNVDSVTITPLDVADTTADEFGDLDLVASDLSDPANAVFTISGADADLTGASVVFEDADGDTVTEVLPADGDFNSAFAVDLSSLEGDVTATLTVSDGTNTAIETADFTLDDGAVPNDGTETVGGVEFTIYEAENAATTGTTDEVTTAEDDRGQSGGAFVDFDGAGDVSITWTVEVAQAGTYQVDFIYALATGKAARPMQLSVDGGAPQTVPFPANSNQAETEWGPSTVQLDLQPGVHTLALSAGGNVSPNLDYLRITSAPLTEPLDLTADEGNDLALSVIDQTDASAVLFEVAGLDDDIQTIEVAFNGGTPQTVTLDGDGQFTADVGITFGQVNAELTVTDDANNTASTEVGFAVAPNGNPNADIEVQSLDPVFFDDRLHFSFVNNSDGRASKETAQFEITNTGTETLDIVDFTISEFYSVVDPSALSGASIAAGDSLVVTVEFDGSTGGPDGFPSRSSNVSGVYEGTLTLVTNDAEDPFTSLDLAAFWQPAQEGGNEPNVNEVWKVLGFGNQIANLPFAGGGEDSILDFDDLYLPAPGQEGIEILSPYWRIADGVSTASATIIAAYNASASAGLGIHAPGNKGQDVNLTAWAPSSQSQTLFPLENGGGFAIELFDNGDIPNGWAGNDIFGIEMAGLSTDPTLNPSGNGTPSQSALNANYANGPYTVTGTGAAAVVTDGDGEVVQDGYTVRMFQALDADGNPIENVYLGMMDYTGINYDYNDNMFIFEGITPVGFGGVLALSGLDDAAADDRLVFTNIENPNNAGGLAQNFRNEGTFTITNDGFADLDITGLSLGGADAGAFQIVSGPTGGTTLAAGQSVDVTVEFVGTDGVDDNAAVLYNDASLTVETAASGSQTIALAGLAQLQSESGEEPTVQQIVDVFGYGTDVAQGSLNGGGDVETVGDEVLMPYLQRLDGSQPVEVINLAAFLQQTDISRLHLHELDSAALTELFAGDDQQGQTVLPDGLVVGAGDTGSVGQASIDRDAPFGLKVTVDGRPTFAAWTDPEVNKADDELGVDDEGHYIRFFQAKDGSGADIPGTFIGIQDYPGGGNFDYNDAMFLVRNVQPYDPAGAEDGNSNGVIDALETDADSDGTVDFFDSDTTQPSAQAPFGGTAPVLGDSLTLEADEFDTGGQGVAWNDDPGKNGGDATRGDSDVEILGGAIAFVEAGEWVEYTIDVAEAGTYDIGFVAKAPTDGATIAVSIENGPTLATVTLPDANGPGNDGFGGTSFGPTDTAQITLGAGEQTLRLTFGGTVAENGYVLDLSSITLEKVDAGTGNTPPTTTGITGAPEATEGEAYSFDVSGFFADADPGDTLSFTASGLPAGLSISAGGVISGTPDDVAGDTDVTVTVTAEDDDGASVSSDFTLSVADVPAPSGQEPFPGPDAPTFAGGELTVAAANYDQGGQGVAYNDNPGLDGGSTGGRPGSDVEQTPLGDVGWISDGEWLEYTIDVPADGLYDLDLLMATNGGPGRTATVDVFRPGEDAAYATTGPVANPVTGGWTTFETRSATSPLQLEAGEQIVRVTFNGGSQDIRSFTLTAQDPVDPNQAPVGSPIPAASVDEGGSVSIDAASAFTDPDQGDTLSYTASGLPAGLSISSAGLITGTAPEVSADTDFTVTVTATDEGGLSDSETFTLTVENVPDPDPAQTPFPGPDAPGFSDGTLTVDASNYDEGGQGVAYNDAPGLQGGSDGGRAGSDVEQGGGNIGWVQDGEWLEYTIVVPADGLYDIDLLLATPGNGRSVTADFYLPGGDTPYVSSGEIANPASGSFGNYQPRSADGIALQAGEQIVRVTLEGGSQNFSAFTLTQQETTTPNQAPTSTDIADAAVAEGAPISLDVSGAFEDPDQDTLSYTLTGPVGLSISAAGVITGTAPEVDADTGFDVTVTASDGELTASETFTLTVENVPDPDPVQTPFPGPNAPVIGADAVTIDASNVDTGGQGVAWNDDPGKDGSPGFRPDLDVEFVGSQNDIGFVEPGEWVEYTVNVEEAGTYALSVNAKTPIGGNTITASLEDGPVLATFALPDANGANDDGFDGTSFASTPAQNVTLGAGLQTLRFTFDGTAASNGYILDMRAFTLEAVDDAEPDPIGESGTLTFAQSSSDEWFTVTFANELDSPAVIMGPISLNGGQPGTMRVQNVTSTGFEFQLDEWNYLDGGHIGETVSWIAVESGVHSIGGQTVVAGVGSTSESGALIDFGTTFDEAPVVLAQVTSTNDADAVTDRIDAVTTTGFEVGLDDEEANDTTHGAESVAWLAMEAGGSPSSGVYAAATPNEVTHNPFTVLFGDDFVGDFAFLADMQTEDGGDPATVRLESLSNSQATFFIEEEQSSDAEIGHTSEVVGFVGITTGVIFDDDFLA